MSLFGQYVCSHLFIILFSAKIAIFRNIMYQPLCVLELPAYYKRLRYLSTDIVFLDDASSLTGYVCLTCVPSKKTFRM